MKAFALLLPRRTQVLEHRDPWAESMAARTAYGRNRLMKDAPHKPNEFFTQEVIAEGARIRILVNGKQTIDFTDPNKTYTKGHFALQGHDPGSVMTFKKVEYKPLKK